MILSTCDITKIKCYNQTTMIVNCPRCGFSQPKDQYCASCGVDMQSYRPSSPPLWKSLLVNPVFLIALSFAVVMGSVAYIRQKQREELASRAELLRSGPVIVQQSQINEYGESAQASQQPAASAEDTQKSRPQTLAAAISQDSEQPEPLADSQNSNSGVPPEAATRKITASAKLVESEPKKELKNDILKVNFYYAEVSTRALEIFEEESRNMGGYTDFGDFRGGQLSDIKKRMTRASGVVVLQQINKEFNTKNPQQQWFLGRKHADGHELGITTFLSIDTINSEHIRGEIELLRSFIELQGTEEALRKISSPQLNFDIADRKSGYMVRMPLPRQIAKDPESLSPEGILRIFNSQAFQNGTSEFTLFLDFDSSSL